MSGARCDLSDLPADQCACRIHAKKEPPRDRPKSLSTRPFPARYRGRCEWCGEWFDVETMLVWAGDNSGYIHEECAE